jgi:nicotinamide mononucleotide transporter
VPSQRSANIDIEETILNSLEIAAVVLSLAAVWWTSVRNPVCWPVGLVSVLLYGWIFVGARLYSDALLQVVYAALQCYGWWNWRRSRPLLALPEAASAVAYPRLEPDGIERERRPAVVVPRADELRLALGLGGAGAIVLGAVMAYGTDAALPWLDATLAALSLVAQYWMARLFRANWLLWIAVDLVYVVLYLNRALPLTAALYAGFVALAVVGWRKWRPIEPLH